MTGYSRAADEVQTTRHWLQGDAGLVSGDQGIAPYCVDRRGEFGAPALTVARPKTADQVAAMVRLCAQRSIAIVPQGGDSSLAGGAVPTAGRARIVPDLSRMNAIRSVDPIGMTMTYRQAANDQASAGAARHPQPGQDPGLEQFRNSSTRGISLTCCFIEFSSREPVPLRSKML